MAGGRGGPGAGARGGVLAGPVAGGAGACGPEAVAGPGPAASAVPLARGTSGFLPRRADRAAAAATAAGLGAAVRGAAARATAADPVLRGAADMQCAAAAAAAAVQQEQPAVGQAAAHGEPDGAGLGLMRRGRSRTGPAVGDRRGGSPRGARYARSRGCSSFGASAGRLQGAQIARRRAEKPAPGAQRSPLKPYGPATPISGNYPGIQTSAHRLRNS